MNFMHVAKTEAGVLQNHFISWHAREAPPRENALIAWLSHPEGSQRRAGITLA
jgi:hypothetical protein